MQSAYGISGGSRTPCIIRVGSKVVTECYKWFIIHVATHTHTFDTEFDNSASFKVVIKAKALDTLLWAVLLDGSAAGPLAGNREIRFRAYGLNDRQRESMR